MGFNVRLWNKISKWNEKLKRRKLIDHKGNWIKGDGRIGIW